MRCIQKNIVFSVRTSSSVLTGIRNDTNFDGITSIDRHESNYEVKEDVSSSTKSLFKLTIHFNCFRIVVYDIMLGLCYEAIMNCSY